MVITRRVAGCAFIICFWASLTMTAIAPDFQGGRSNDRTQLVSMNPFGLILLPW